jgi:hypothetical protein
MWLSKEGREKENKTMYQGGGENVTYASEGKKKKNTRIEIYWTQHAV